MIFWFILGCGNKNIGNLDPATLDNYGSDNNGSGMDITLGLDNLLLSD